MHMHEPLMKGRTRAGCGLRRQTYAEFTDVGNDDQDSGSRITTSSFLCTQAVVLLSFLSSLSSPFHSHRQTDWFPNPSHSLSLSCPSFPGLVFHDVFDLHSRRPRLLSTHTVAYTQTDCVLTSTHSLLLFHSLSKLMIMILV